LPGARRAVFDAIALASEAEKSGIQTLRLAENSLKSRSEALARPALDVFHSVFHSCGNLGEHTEARL